MESDLAQDLQQAAVEEMARACTLGWAQLKGCTPWGDSFEGVTPAGRDAVFERNYLWADQPGGEIVCEVIVYENLAAYDAGARLIRHIRPGDEA